MIFFSGCAFILFQSAIVTKRPNGNRARYAPPTIESAVMRRDIQGVLRIKRVIIPTTFIDTARSERIYAGVRHIVISKQERHLFEKMPGMSLLRYFLNI